MRSRLSAVGGFRDVIVGPPGVSEQVAARLRNPPRRPAAWWVVLVVSLLAGVALIGLGAAHLREAHLYRQASGEGLLFAWIGLFFWAAHLLLGLAGFAISRLRAGTSDGRLRTALLGVGVALAVGLVVADAVAIWVEWHGDRCIGACG